MLHVVETTELKDFGLYGIYLFYFLLTAYVVRGSIAYGQPLRDGKKRIYTCNGLATLILLLVVVNACVFMEYFDITVIVDRYWNLFFVVNIWAFSLSIYLYFFPKKPVSSGNALMDFWGGIELNPEIFPGVDLKIWSLKPAMMGWTIINLSFLYKQYQLYDFISTPMMLYQFISFWYVADYFYNERRMLSTWDIVSEHFGLMLVWGDYAFIPFAFSSQCFWLLDPSEVGHLSHLQYAFTIIVFVSGLYIFRVSNNQKDDFKTLGNRAVIDGQPPKLIAGKLLVSGMWGVVRKPNYIGDLLIALALSSTCGIKSGFGPYFYFIYLTILLFHRAHRDYLKCKEKYREIWTEYCKAVPYNMIPYIY